MKIFLPATFVLFFINVLLAGSEHKNVLLICIDDLRPELGCYGVDYIHTPNIDGLAAKSQVFKKHYVQAPTCGASRYTLLTGNYGPARNNALMLRAKKLKNNKLSPSMPAWYKEHGYTTCSIGKVSHYPGGLSGAEWDDPSEVEMPKSWDKSEMPSGAWKHPRGAMHALANGEIREKSGNMDVFQSTEGDDSTYPDGLITSHAQQQLKTLTKGDSPFFLAVGFIRPHLPLGAPAKYLELYKDTKFPPIPHPNKPDGNTTWHESSEFMKYNNWGKDPRKDQEFATEVRRHYAACVSYADAQVGKLLTTLKETGADKNTIIVLWGDHGWHLGEHAIWGKHSLFEESLHAPLLISTPANKPASRSIDTVVETIDIFPTLCELTNLPIPSSINGQSMVQLMNNADKIDHLAVSYNARAATIRSATHRLIAHKNGALELYDFSAKDRGSINCAKQQPETAQLLIDKLKHHFSSSSFNK
ncbi:MAG: sulfatase [Rubritalea sp.]|uniref:sulfatase n=1 Tax=Rubritalea sp. TaxID=2109375 RepID=UPI0032425462